MKRYAEESAHRRGVEEAEQSPVIHVRQGSTVYFTWVHMPGEILSGKLNGDLVDVKSHKWREQPFSLSLKAIDIVHQHGPRRSSEFAP